MKLKNILSENDESVETLRFGRKEKHAFLEACKSYSKSNPSIYRNGNIKDKIEEIRDLVEIAEQLTLQETENWFDNVTVSRHMKQLKEAFKVFEKTGQELDSLQQRFESSYEDIGEVLSKYYEVG